MPASALTLCPHAHRAPAENQPAWSAGSSRLPGQQLLPHSLPSANALQLARPATLFLDHVSYQLPSHLSLLFAASTPQRSCSRPLPALRRPPGQLSPRPHGHQCPLPLCSSCHLPAAGPHPADHASCPRDCSDIIFFRVSSYCTQLTWEAWESGLVSSYPHSPGGSHSVLSLHVPPVCQWLLFYFTSLAGLLH